MNEAHLAPPLNRADANGPRVWRPKSRSSPIWVSWFPVRKVSLEVCASCRSHLDPSSLHFGCFFFFHHVSMNQLAQQTTRPIHLVDSLYVTYSATFFSPSSVVPAGTRARQWHRPAAGCARHDGRCTRRTPARHLPARASALVGVNRPAAPLTKQFRFTERAVSRPAFAAPQNDERASAAPAAERAPAP